jgi:hypothetical protein
LDSARNSTAGALPSPDCAINPPATPWSIAFAANRAVRPNLENTMKLLLITALIAIAVGTTPAHARKDCTELKNEIAAKIDANGVKSYALEIVPSDTESTAKVVGSCNGGTERIVYQRAPVATEAMVAGEPK